MNPESKVLPRLLVGVVALGALVHVASLFPTAWSLVRAVPPDARWRIVTVSASLIIAVLACALALLLVVRAGRRYEARGLALFLSLIAICWGSVLRFASLERGPDGAPTGLEISISGAPFVLAVLALALASASLLDLSTRFPEDLSAGEIDRRAWIRRRWVPWALALVTPLLILRGLTPIRWARALGAPEPTLRAAVFWGLGIIAAIIAVIILGMVGLAVANFLRGYRLADGESRRTALWLVVGVAGSALLVLASALVFALEVALPISLGLLSRYTPLIVLLAPLVMVVCVAVAILYSGAVDPALALRRSTINGLAGTLGLLVFAGLENSLSAWVEGRLGLPGAIGSFLAGTVSAGVFLPVQRRLSRSAAGSGRRVQPS